MSESRPSVLVTGANGFVGSRLCRELSGKHFHVIAGVRKNAKLGLLESLDLDYRYGDVTQPDNLVEMVERVDYVIHNAGLTKAKTTARFFEVNEQGTRNLFKAIATHNPDCKKAVYISSQAAAGPSIDGQPVTEQDEPNPITTYGRSKLAGERAALSFAGKYPVISIRPTGVYGPGDKEILSFFETVYKGVKPFIGDVNRPLQLVHVDDLCRAICLSLTASTKSGDIFFAAENRSYKMAELIGLLSAGCGKKGMKLRIPAQLFKTIAGISELAFKLVGGTPMLTREKARELLASWEVATDHAKDVIKYESQIPFEQGAKETYDWYINEGWLK